MYQTIESQQNGRWIVKMNLTERIIADHSGQRQVYPGQIVDASVDLLMMHDHSAPLAIHQFRKLNTHVWDPERIVIVMDHHSPSTSPTAAQFHSDMRRFAEEEGIQNLFDVGSGICHVILREEGFMKPGMLMVGGDSHSVAGGSLGAFATGIGSTEVASVLARGRIWLRVPDCYRLDLKGTLGPTVDHRDLALAILAKFGPFGLNYRALEITGNLLKEFSLNQKGTLCTLGVEMGAKNTIIGSGKPEGSYAKDFEMDVSGLVPQVAIPYLPNNARNIEDVEGVKINQANISSCVGATLEDIRTAAQVLEGRKIKKGVRLIVSPASRNTWLEADRAGWLSIIAKAGGAVSSPACGGCAAYEISALAPGEVCISTSSRNMEGRMGPGGVIYLGSSATVAASAVMGEITDPRKLVK
jgi:3-isopropylmalate dehydratase large subunit